MQPPATQAPLSSLSIPSCVRQSPLLLPRDADPAQQKVFSAQPRPPAAPPQMKASPRNSISWNHDAARAASASPRQAPPSRPHDPRFAFSWGASYAPRHASGPAPYHRAGDGAHPPGHRSSPHPSRPAADAAVRPHSPAVRPHSPDSAAGHGAAHPGGPVGIGMTLVRDPTVRF